jgi:hypothetical protein
MISPGSCSIGFRSRPSSAAGSRRTNGLEVNRVKPMKPIAIRPITPSTRASTSRGRLRLKVATAALQKLRISTHSSSEPSCPPQTPETLYWVGSSELEWFAT